jgi:hypothetical protein
MAIGRKLQVAPIMTERISGIDARPGVTIALNIPGQDGGNGPDCLSRTTRRTFLGDLIHGLRFHPFPAP